MLLTHKHNKSLVKSFADSASLSLTNSSGAFLSIGHKSRYNGLFIPFKNDILKCISHLSIPGEVTHAYNNFSTISRTKNNIHETYSLIQNTKGLSYSLSKPTPITLFFDVRKLYDTRIWGHQYKYKKKKNIFFIDYTKKTDSREDHTHDQKEFSVTIAIQAQKDADFLFSDEWQEHYFSYDEQRHSFPWNRYLYKGLKITTNHLNIGIGENESQALLEIRKIRSSQKQMYQFRPALTLPKKITKECMAYLTARHSLDQLIVNNNDIYAGLPWFSQYWSRDTMVSLNAFILEKKYHFVKNIISKYLENIQQDGHLPNRVPKTTLSSKDATGWMFHRIDNFLTLLKKKKVLLQFYKKAELGKLEKKLVSMSDLIIKNETQDSLAYNGPQETWMDTKNTKREGARIEIQALRLSMYHLLSQLTKNSFYTHLEKKLVQKVKENFLKNNYLYDGLNDPTIRPNVFIAAYIYPKLLSKEEWKKCFTIVLPKLWLDWGGIATIDKSHPSFHSCHSGEDPQSYHQGDSWYWLNNLSAIVLSRIDKKYFSPYIEKIRKASINDILWQGYLGSHSELSSASAQEAFGCYNQAWSNAFFIELIHEYR